MLKLYHTENSADCEKILFALDHLGIEYQGIVVPADHQPKTPLLRDGDTDISDSTRILEHLAERHDSSLLSTDPLEQGLASLLEDWADEVLAKIVGASKNAGDRVPEDLDNALEKLDLALHDRSYMVGQGLSSADLATYAHLASLPEATRTAGMEPYVNLRDWYFNISDFRAKSQGRRGSAMFDE
ncbi:MAG: glutathione S-transferase family protein [bacterium]